MLHIYKKQLKCQRLLNIGHRYFSGRINMNKTIDVTVDNEINLGNSILGNRYDALISSKTESMLTDVLQSNINKLINSVIELFDDCNIKSDNYEIGDITFNISINAESQVSIMSLISGGVSANTGINVQLRKKNG